MINTRNLLTTTAFLAAILAQSAIGCRSQQTYAAPGHQPNPSAAGLQWTTVRDTNEQAFSVQVPKGWAINGGLIRPAHGYPHPFIDMSSPDNKTNVRLGDATIPSYNLPNRIMPILNTGQSVAPYATGEEFAIKYGQARLGSLCQGLQQTRSGPRDPRYPVKPSQFVRITGGDAAFTCTANGQPMVGYSYAETMQVSFNGMSGNWFVVGLASFLTPASQAAATGVVLKHTAESIAFNPEWLQMQSRIISWATQVNLKTAQGNMDAIKETNERMKQWSHSQAAEVDNFNDILTGTTVTRDPQSGVIREVPTGAGGTHWIDTANHTATGAFAPGPDYHQLDTITREQTGQY